MAQKQIQEGVTVASCIGIITGCIVLSKAEAWFYYPANKPSQSTYVMSSVAPAQNPQIYNPQKRISREQYGKFVYGGYARGQSTKAMRSVLGSPYASAPASNVEFYPFDHDPNTWVAFQYDRQGRYIDHGLSVNNQIVDEPPIHRVLARSGGYIQLPARVSVSHSGSGGGFPTRLHRTPQHRHVTVLHGSIAQRNAQVATIVSRARRYRR